MNSVYAGLSGIKPLAKNYAYKFLFIAFLGIHIPLIGVIIFILTSKGPLPPGILFVLTLLLTLGATAVTLAILNKLLAPLKMSKTALEQYLHQRKLPQLPRQYKDEAGILMSKLQETITTLDALLEEKKDFISLLSHDLRTPLASIQLLSRSLETDAPMDAAERKRIAAMISLSTREQLTFFQRVLDILKNEDLQKMQLELADVRVKNMIEHSLNDLQPIAEQKNIHIIVSCKEDPHIIADDTLLSQVVKNIVSNAIKFSHPGSDVHVDVAPYHDKVQIAVSDHGLGFNPEDSEKLFQRFTNLRKAGTDNEVSTGMGLYLSSKIVKAHHGSLSAKSEGINKGATFTIEV